jgi:alpha-1,3-rhamnosyl/mannosyltransferase
LTSVTPPASDSPTKLRVALGATVLERARNSNGHLDGIGTYTAELLKHLSESEIDARPIACEGFRGTKVSDSVESMPGSFAFNLIKSAVTGTSFSGTADLAKRFDIFHATDHHVPKIRKLPVVATVMDPIPLMHPEWTDVSYRQLKNWLFRRSVQWADHYITISQFVITDIAYHFRIPAERITAIELGVNEDFFTMLSAEEKSKSLEELGLKAPFFLFIGTLQPRKNILRMIEAFKMLPIDMQRACPLIVAGREGWSSVDERQALASLEDDKTGRWLNYVTPLQKKALLQSARALVFPSLYEGFGLPVLEAFASGLPVITSNTTSLPEVAGDAALMVTPTDAGEIADAMRRMIEDDALWQKLKVAGSARAREFTWEKTANRTADLYRKILR